MSYRKNFKTWIDSEIINEESRKELLAIFRNMRGI